MDVIFSGFNDFFNVMRTFGITDFLDIAVVSFIIYAVIKLMRETRAEQLAKGILILLLMYAIAYQLNLKMLSALLSNFFQFGVFALLVVFQPELRRMLEQIGNSNIRDYWAFNPIIRDGKSYIEIQKKCISDVVEVASSFQKTKTGALIVFERKTKLADIISTGVVINARSSVALIGNIFFNKAPLHDGAMIIRGGIVCAAGCILPLTKNEDVSIDLGTRHRAALGISENSDAIVLIVSEETGTISVVVNGVLKRNYTSETLKNELEGLLIPNIVENDHKIIPSFRKEKKNEQK